ncbi:MAG: hypothetical protein IJZ74_03745 [Clostridia bacterium]|nr:hypothetical protein [Clostridia bacterium]
MNETNRSLLIPFQLSGSHMRRRAALYRRYGQVPEALTLLRRAAEQDDTAAGWQALAEEMRLLGNWETASMLLGRVLSRADHAPSAWLAMGRCQAALGQTELAIDCLYHQLQEDAWSPEGDAARTMMPELDAQQQEREPRRVPMLVQRGLRSWHAGDRQLGSRRMERAVRITAHRDRLMVTLALLHMMCWDYAGAMRWLAKALRQQPDSPRALCAMSAVLQQLGKPRAARGFLRKAMPRCTDVRLADQFLTSAWALNAWPEMETYLDAQLKRYPYRTALLNARATMLYEQGRTEEAQETWRLILSVDPGDRRAASMQAWTKRHPEAGTLPAPGKLPQPVVDEQRRLVQPGDAASKDVLRHGSQERIVMDWFASSMDAEEAELALTAACGQCDAAAETRFLRELLARPGVQQAVSQRALIRLAELGCTEQSCMLAGNRYTIVQCQKTTQSIQRSTWRLFLPMLLRETRRYGESPEIAQFAASLWAAMSPAQRQNAAVRQGYLWCKGMEVLWLRLTGREERAVRVARYMLTSQRRIRRVLRQLGALMEVHPALTGEGDTE